MQHRVEGDPGHGAPSGASPDVSPAPSSSQPEVLAPEQGEPLLSLDTQPQHSHLTPEASQPLSPEALLLAGPPQPGSEKPPIRIPPDLERWPDTSGYPPISGGSGRQGRKKREPEEKEYWWDGLYIPMDAFYEVLEQFYRERHPDWDERTIAREVEYVVIARKIDEYEELQKLPHPPKEKIKQLEREIKRRRYILGLPD